MRGTIEAKYGLWQILADESVVSKLPAKRVNVNLPSVQRTLSARNPAVVLGSTHRHHCRTNKRFSLHKRFRCWWIAYNHGRIFRQRRCSFDRIAILKGIGQVHFDKGGRGLPER